MSTVHQTNAENIHPVDIGASLRAMDRLDLPTSTNWQNRYCQECGLKDPHHRFDCPERDQ
jgi:hypothetical protein